MIKIDISWDFHVQRLCQTMYYHLSLLRRLRPIFPKDLLLQVYKSYIQPRLDYGITLYSCSTQKNIDLVQRVQNHAARLITGNFDFINCRGIDLIKSLNLYTIREKKEIISLQHWCLKLTMGSRQRTFPIALLWILM